VARKTATPRRASALKKWLSPLILSPFSSRFPILVSQPRNDGFPAYASLPVIQLSVPRTKIALHALENEHRLFNEPESEEFCSLFSPFPSSILCSLPQFSPIFYHSFSPAPFLVFVKPLRFLPSPLFHLKNNG